jgi:hypothetical protein
MALPEALLRRAGRLNCRIDGSLPGIVTITRPVRRGDHVVRLEPAGHKTRTFCPMPETGRFDKRGRPMHDRFSAAICSCGWVKWERDRPAAQRLAREHREAQAKTSTAI